jgi:hypothetical protein
LIPPLPRRGRGDGRGDGGGDGGEGTRRRGGVTREAVKGREELGDEGGVTWETAPRTVKASGALGGLEQSKRHFFRVGSVTNAGMGAFN